MKIRTEREIAADANREYHRIKLSALQEKLLTYLQRNADKDHDYIPRNRRTADSLVRWDFAIRSSALGYRITERGTMWLDREMPTEADEPITDEAIDASIADQHRVGTIRMWRHVNCGTCKTQADAVEHDHAEGLRMNAVVDRFADSYAFSIDGSPDCNDEQERAYAYDRCKELAWEFDQERSAFDDLIAIAAKAYSRSRAAQYTQAMRISHALDSRNDLWAREQELRAADAEDELVEDPRDVAIRSALSLCDHYAGPEPTVYGEGPYRSGMRDLAKAVAEQIRTALSTYPECLNCDGRVELVDGVLLCVNCGEEVRQS
jgi:hypothetical protein